MTRLTLTILCACAALIFSSTAMAQGTATAPSTVHVADSANQAGYASGANDTINGPGPYPIDLDVTGLPWRKAFKTDPTTGYVGGGGFSLFEEMVNVGIESWDGWVADLSGGALGVGWSGVNDVRVNGSSISFNTNITGTVLTLDSFSIPVSPGDILELDIDLVTTANVIGPGASVTLFSVQQFPTAIPEPASMALLGLGGLAIFGRRRDTLSRSAGHTGHTNGGRL
jgi:PEP-CTERM motif